MLLFPRENRGEDHAREQRNPGQNRKPDVSLRVLRLVEEGEEAEGTQKGKEKKNSLAWHNSSVVVVGRTTRLKKISDSQGFVNIIDRQKKKALMGALRDLISLSFEELTDYTVEAFPQSFFRRNRSDRTAKL